MSAATDRIKFVTALMPVLYELVHTLFDRHKGNVEAAKIDISRIRNHSMDLTEWEADLKVRLDALKAKERKS